MGFTNVAWESRGTERLARDLTAGPGPASVGQTGAAWVRVANELAGVAEDYTRIVEKVKTSFAGQGAQAAARKLEDFGQWLRDVSPSAAANGQRAEEAAVADGVAVLSMPSVSEAVEAKAAHDIMASLAAYNGAVLNGRFAELDDAVTTAQADASAVMYRYEQACENLAAPWGQPLPPDVCAGAALTAQRNAAPAADGARGGAGHVGGGGAAAVPPPLTPLRVLSVGNSGEASALKTVGSAGTTSAGTTSSGMGSMGSGYGPMAALGRGDQHREHESGVPGGSLDGIGEVGAGVSDAAPSWLPVVQQNDAPFVVSEVSWGPDTSLFDQIAVPEGPEAAPYADTPQPMLEQVSQRWVSSPVIGADRGVRL
jgi:hypothetical protein